MSEQEDFRVVFLFGAGSSLRAGLVDVKRLTDEFLTTLDRSHEFEEPMKEKIRILSNIASDHFSPKRDLESIMTLVSDLNGEQQKKLFQSKYNQLDVLSDFDLKAINNHIHSYLRNALQNVNSHSVSYLFPLLGFSQNLEIFTLNYDGVLDIFLEKSRVDYTDGFSPYWSPHIFDDNRIRVKIYRLHGSLFWFKIPNGKVIRIPIRFDIQNMKYISGEDLDEMLIYPTLTKEKHYEIYSFLSNRFISKLRSSQLCIVMGYSFRDKDITDVIIEGLQSNQDLWIVIVSPHATDHKQLLAVGTPEMNSRIICIDTDMEDILKGGKLYQGVRKLMKTISTEQIVWEKQLHSEGVAALWDTVLKRYYDLEARDRVAYIRNKLITQYGILDTNIPKNFSSGQVQNPWK